MQSIPGRFHARRFLVTLFSIAVFLSNRPSVSAQPAMNAPAPPLKLAELLQAPKGATAEWSALRGKAVVLEFWATWCGPCIAAIPHLNRLIESVDPAKFQFIAVDDEDPQVIHAFLARKKMEGWIGIDTSGAVFRRYHVTARPTTIVVDPEGKIAAITDADAITTQALKAVAAGQHPDFPPSTALLATTLKASPSAAPAARPIFEISLSKTPPDQAQGKDSTWMKVSQSGVELHAVTAKYLLTYVFQAPADRFEFTSPLPDDRFDLRTVFARTDSSVTTPMLQAAVAAGLHLTVTLKTVSKSVYMLKATPAAAGLVKPSASSRGSEQMGADGKMDLVNVSMAQLAASLEDWLETPVVDQTGIPTHFDAGLEFPSKDVTEINQRLRAALGVELTSEERQVEVLEVAPQQSKQE